MIILVRAYTHAGLGTPTASQHNILTRTLTLKTSIWLDHLVFTCLTLKTYIWLDQFVFTLPWLWKYVYGLTNLFSIIALVWRSWLIGRYNPCNYLSICFWGWSWFLWLRTVLYRSCIENVIQRRTLGLPFWLSGGNKHLCKIVILLVHFWLEFLMCNCVFYLIMCSCF